MISSEIACWTEHQCALANVEENVYVCALPVVQVHGDVLNFQWARLVWAEGE